MQDSERQTITTIAEIIAVGDEMTSGQRLDTNTQWLAQQLNDLGIEVAYHSTVGDDLQRQTQVIKTATGRANIVILTGGLGPTKDDLTRQAIADAAGVELLLDADAVEHIQSIFARNRRTMPSINRNQALFPAGGRLIHNEEGTAPGVDFRFEQSRIFALPGVPYEMKLMWQSWVAPELVAQFGSQKVIRHHVLRCFGVGESEAESRMPGLTDRDRQPRVGITASKSIISFRITATAESEKVCETQIESTEMYIRQTLGEVVFGAQDDELGTVTANLLIERGLSVSFVDFHLGSAAAMMLRSGIAADRRASVLPTFIALEKTPGEWVGLDNLQGSEQSNDALSQAAVKICELSATDLGIAIGPIEDIGEAGVGKFDVSIADRVTSEVATRRCNHSGHSSMRAAKSINQVINFLRIHLGSLRSTS